MYFGPQAGPRAPSLNHDPTDSFVRLPTLPVVQAVDVMMTMPNYGNRVTYSTAQFVEEMDAVSRGLIAMGFAEEKVALISHNNGEVDWTTPSCRQGQSTSPSPTMTEDYKYILNHSESSTALSSEELYNKVMAVKAECPTLEDVLRLKT